MSEPAFPDRSKIETEGNWTPPYEDLGSKAEYVEPALNTKEPEPGLSGDWTWDELVKFANMIAKRAIADLSWEAYLPALDLSHDDGDAAIIVKLLNTRLRAFIDLDD